MGWQKAHADWLREFFFTNPDASVDDGARAANNARRGLPRGMVAEIRREVRARIEAEKQNELAEEQRRETELKLVPPPPPSDKPPVGSTRSDADVEIRRRYLNDLLEKNPNVTIHEAAQAVRERFGMSLDYSYICETVRLAKEVAQVSFNPPKVITTPPPPEKKLDNDDMKGVVTACARGMKALRVRRLVIEVSEAGDVSWESEVFAVQRGGLKL